MTGLSLIFRQEMERSAKRRKHGTRRQQPSFVLGGVTYSLGDYAWMWSGDGDPKNRKNHYVAEVRDIWEDGAGVLWFEANWYDRDVIYSYKTNFEVVRLKFRS